MFERNVSVKQVAQTLHTGETIEDYSAETPEPSQLLLGFQGKRPLHVVTSENRETHEITIITVYRPEPVKWNNSFTRRRS